MKQCVKCLSDNVSTIVEHNHIFYYCSNCQDKSAQVIDNDGQNYATKENGLIKHVTVGAVIKHKGKILFINRQQFPHGFGIPTTHLHYEESVEIALKRLFSDKLGLALSSKKLVFHQTVIDPCRYGAELHECYIYQCTIKKQATSISPSTRLEWFGENKLDSIDLIPNAKIILSRLKFLDNNGEEIASRDVNRVTKASESSIIDSLALSIVIVNKKGKPTFVNTAAENFLHSLKNRSTRDYEKFSNELTRIAQKSIHDDLNVSSTIKKQNETYNIVANPLRSNGTITGATIVVKDITKEINREARDTLTYKASLSLGSKSSFLSIIESILKQVFDAMDVTGANLMIAENDQLRSIFSYSTGSDKKHKPLVLQIGEGIAGQVAKTRLPLAVLNTEKEQKYIPVPHLKPRSLYSAPVLSDGKILGVLNLTRQKNIYFSEEEAKVASIVANRIAQAIENENLYKQLSSDKKTLETVLTTTSDGLILLNRDLKLVFANPAAIAINKLTKDEVKNNHINNFIKRTSPENIKRFLDAVTKSIDQKKQITVDFVSIKGPVKIVRTVFNPIVEKDGKCDSVLIGFNNVTKVRLKQQQVQKKIKQITALFKISSVSHSTTGRLVENVLQKTKEIFDSAEEGIYLFDSKLLPSLSANTEINKIIEANRDLLAKASHGGVFNNAKEELSSESIRHIILIPIKPKDSTVGYLYVVSKKSHFSSEDSKILNIIASRIALRLESDALIKQLENDRKKLQNIIDNTADGILAVDAEENQLLWNKSMEELTGFANTNQYFEKNPDRKKVFQVRLAEIAQGKGELEFSERFTAVNSEDQPININGTYSIVKNTDGVAEYIIGVLRDAAKDVEMENQQKEFIYTTTHELRTPITAVKGYLSMILNGDAGKVTDKQKLFFNRAYSSTERLVGLVEDLLKVARLEENRMHFEIETISAKKLINEIISDFEHKAKVKGLSIKVSQKKDIELLGDYNLTKQAISNLVDNAIKYTKKGSIQIVIDQSPGFGYISIVDFGVGIPKKEQAAVFDKFHRVFNSESIKAGGTGLGLFIVKNLIEKQGGQVSLESKLGQGSTFKISLPLAKKIIIKE